MKHRGFLRQWKYSIWHCKIRYMSLYICQNPENVQHPEGTLMYTMDFGWFWHGNMGLSVVTNVPLYHNSQDMETTLSVHWQMNGLRRCGPVEYSAITKNEIMPFAATRMQLEILIPSEASQKEKYKHIRYHLYVESKIQHKWTYPQNRNRLTDMENRLVVAKGEEGGSRMNWEFGVSRCKLWYLEWISSQVLLYSTGNWVQSLGIEHDGQW